MLIEAKIADRLSTRHAYNVIVIGSGPVGVHAVQEFIKHNPNRHIAIFGDEPWKPYNRVKLSSLISGEIKEESVYTDTRFSKNSFIHTFYNNRIIDINRHSKTVIDSQGKQYHYSKLILATGSSPHIPSINGISHKNIFTFRDLSDAQKLVGRSIRTQKTVVIGGGLLGLEAARAMQRFNTEVTVIEHNMWLMFNQLDINAASYLKKHIENLNINIRTNTYVKEISGSLRVESIVLGNGEKIQCDSIIIATGISPNIELARNAGLAIGRGIRVNDYLQTSDDNIFAIGECAEHRNKIYGLVAPGYEQAAIVSYNIAINKATYTGSITATNLKVVNYPVFSIGNTGEQARSREMHSFQDAKKGIYRKIIVINGRLRGAIATGEMQGLNRLQEAVINERRVWAWQINRFLKEGYLWPANESKNVNDWPANAIVCNCTGVTRSCLDEAKKSGADSVAELSRKTGASTVCGSCNHLLTNFIGNQGTPTPSKGHKILLATSVTGVLICLLLFLLPGIFYNKSAQELNWDFLWRDSLLKQISGYSLLGLSLTISIISIRKRWPEIIQKWNFAYWRIAHVTIGLALMLALLMHTGFRFGVNLNFYLMLTFSGLLISGAITGTIIASEHSLSHKTARRLRSFSAWSHIILLWPLPALLSFHIIKTYFF
ncbi:MAG: FAD-dependent oxidoreductase [Gammaproteobacteria bacterium]|nr:FAD-dependent oxidoreductase [Gammaproteobacteria bacterium]